MMLFAKEQEKLSSLVKEIMRAPPFALFVAFIESFIHKS